MINWVIKTEMDEAAIQKATEEFGKEFDHLKSIIHEIFEKHPVIPTDEFLKELPEGIDENSALSVLSILATGSEV